MVNPSRREVGSDNGLTNRCSMLGLPQYVDLIKLADFKTNYPRFFAEFIAAAVI
jgi:hypothetical protein